MTKENFIDKWKSKVALGQQVYWLIENKPERFLHWWVSLLQDSPEIESYNNSFIEVTEELLNEQHDISYDLGFKSGWSTAQANCP